MLRAIGGGAGQLGASAWLLAAGRGWRSRSRGAEHGSVRDADLDSPERSRGSAGPHMTPSTGDHGPGGGSHPRSRARTSAWQISDDISGGHPRSIVASFRAAPELVVTAVSASMTPTGTPSGAWGRGHALASATRAPRTTSVGPGQAVGRHRVRFGSRGAGRPQRTTMMMEPAASARRGAQNVSGSRRPLYQDPAQAPHRQRAPRALLLPGSRQERG